MKLNTFKYFFLDAIRNSKRNITITVFSVGTISATFFIFELFLLYIMLVNKNYETIFTNNEEMVKVLRLLGIATLIVLLPVSLFLSVNSFKMAILSRKCEIRIMKSVGATDWFIRWPFVIEGVVIGITGAIVGNLLLFFVYSFICTKAIEITAELSFVEPTFITNIMLWKSIIIGAFIGIIGNIIALRKALNNVV